MYFNWDFLKTVRLYAMTKDETITTLLTTLLDLAPHILPSNFCVHVFCAKNGPSFKYHLVSSGLIVILSIHGQCRILKEKLLFFTYMVFESDNYEY